MQVSPLLFGPQNGQEVYLSNHPPGTNSLPKKQSLESSGMEIPDYAIERIAKCLLPIMRNCFENQQKEDNHDTAA